MLLHDLEPTLISADALPVDIDSVVERTETIFDRDVPDTFFLPMPVLREALPKWSWADATGEVTVVDQSKPEPRHRKRRFAPWHEVFRDIRHDRKTPWGLLTLAGLGVAAGLAMASTVPQPSRTPQVVVETPSAKHRRPESPAPSLTPSLSPAASQKPVHAHKPVPPPAPRPSPTQTLSAKPIPSHSAPIPSHSVPPEPEPSPSPSSHTPDPKPTTPKPTLTPTQEPTREPEPVETSVTPREVPQSPAVTPSGTP